MAHKRKVISFDAQLLSVIAAMSRDTSRPLDELADEAFRDLLKKHRRPATLKDALRQSARSHPANDPRPARKKRD